MWFDPYGLGENVLNQPFLTTMVLTQSDKTTIITPDVLLITNNLISPKPQRYVLPVICAYTTVSGVIVSEANIRSYSKMVDMVFAQPSLIGVPVEIRLRIYNFLLEADQLIEIDARSGKVVQWSQALAMLHISKQIGAEVSSCLEVTL